MEDKNIKYHIGKELSGAEFNEYFPNLSKNLIKLTNKTENHNEFQFVTGLNEDTKLFNPKGTCQQGGIYFTDTHKLPRWLYYNNNWMQYYRHVVLPDDCRVYLESDDKFKADKIILSEREEIKKFPLWLDEDYCVNAIRNSEKGYSVEFYIKNFSKEVQLALVTKNEVSVEFLLKRGIEVFEEVQLAAIKNSDSTDVIRYLLNHKVYISDKVKIAAIESNCHAVAILLHHNITNIPEEQLLIAVEKNYHIIGNLLFHEVEVSEEIKLAAVKQQYRAIYFMMYYKTHISEEVKTIATKKSGFTSDELILMSINYFLSRQ